MLDQSKLRMALLESNLNFKIDRQKMDLVWLSEVNNVNEPLLCAEIHFNDQLIPKSHVVCPNGLEEGMIAKMEKFTEVLSLIILARSKKIKTEDGKATGWGQFHNNNDFYQKALLVYDDICSKY